jgi:hypothetical protein
MPPVFGVPVAELKPPTTAGMEARVGAYYMRFTSASGSVRHGYTYTYYDTIKERERGGRGRALARSCSYQERSAAAAVGTRPPCVGVGVGGGAALSREHKSHRAGPNRVRSSDL